MDTLTLVQKIAVWIAPVLLAITGHETAHGWAAKQLGDPTASRLGRLTLNPLRHIDPLGTVLVPALALLLSGFVFGWAKPVPVAWNRLRNPRRDVALVALAGPLANLGQALLWSVVIHFAVLYHGALSSFAGPLVLAGVAGIYVNAILLVLNLLPLPPLDGGRVVASALPPRHAARFARIEPFGIAILLVLILSGALQPVFAPVLEAVWAGLSLVAGLDLGEFFAILRALT